MPMAEMGAEKPYVLVADDDPLIRTVLRHALEQTGYPVIDASNGDEAVMLVGRNDVGLIILDAHMPGPSLQQTITNLKNDPFTVAPPILVFSGDASLPADVVNVAAGHLSKPVEVDQFLHMVANLYAMEKPARS
jgi:CheY-like chemotaxis protein